MQKNIIDIIKFSYAKCKRDKSGYVSLLDLYLIFFILPQALFIFIWIFSEKIFTV